jgi:hypothetical protein
MQGKAMKLSEREKWQQKFRFYGLMRVKMMKNIAIEEVLRRVVEKRIVTSNLEE